MAKVYDDPLGRRWIAKGEFHDVYCAIREDGSCPAGDFLDALKRGEWPDPTVEAFPVDEQITDYHWFVEAINHWARTGEPIFPRRDAVNDLDNGIWEFKHDNKRLSFFDTNGVGGFTPKLRITEPAEMVDGDHPDIPYFDRIIRLGHAFPKTSQNTPPYELSETEKVREEDLTHDRKD